MRNGCRFQSEIWHTYGSLSIWLNMTIAIYQNLRSSVFGNSFIKCISSQNELLRVIAIECILELLGELIISNNSKLLEQPISNWSSSFIMNDVNCIIYISIILVSIKVFCIYSFWLKKYFYLLYDKKYLKTQIFLIWST